MSWLEIWLGVLELFVVLAVLGRSALRVVGLLLLAAERQARKRAADAWRRDQQIARLRGESDRSLEQLESQMPPPEPLTVKELYRLASEGLDGRPVKLPSDGEGKIRG